nr:hypothetical protein [uncultured Flavobacterium sp.]
MDSLIKELEALKNQANELTEKQVIDIENIEIAWKNRNMEIKSFEDCFLLIASLNLLNSAIKDKSNKKNIHYGGIKMNVTRLFDCLIANYNLADDFWINTEENNCAYIKIYNFQFTFHSIEINKSLTEFIKSSRNKVKPWEEIRLQKIANDIFIIAHKIKLKSTWKKL